MNKFASILFWCVLGEKLLGDVEKGMEAEMSLPSVLCNLWLGSSAGLMAEVEFKRCGRLEAPVGVCSVFKGAIASVSKRAWSCVVF